MTPEAYAVTDILGLVLFALFGLAIGSFLNVVIARLPREGGGASIAEGRSCCPTCGEVLRTRDLVPVASWFLLRGRCRYCEAPISKQYPLVELTTAVLFATSWVFSATHVDAALNALVAAVLVCLAVIDWRTQLIPDSLWIAIAVLGVARIGCGYAALLGSGWAPRIVEAAIGAFIVSVPLFALAYLIGGFGGGDVKLMFAAGIYLGWQNIALAFFIGVVLGGIVGVALLATKRATRKTAIAFGPYLAIGIWVATLWGTAIIDWYMGALL